MSEVRNISWWELYKSEDVNEAVDIFSKKNSLILAKTAPIKIFQVYKKYAPWLSTVTKNLMLECNQAQKLQQILNWMMTGSSINH